MKILYTRQDGGVSIVIPAEGKTQEEVISKAVPNDAINIRVISDSDIPASREFRDAWVDVEEGSQIDISVERAKELALQHLRRVRDLKFIETDARYIASLSKGEDTSAIVAEQVMLRNITEDIKAIDATGKYNDVGLINSLSVLKKVLD